jgi:acetylglutamate kinase
VNAELVAALRALGADAVGLSGVDGGLLSGPRADGLGRVVGPSAVRTELLDALGAAGALPVVAPLALDQDGAICNVNADDAAATLAGALTARLVLLTDTDGVRGADGVRISTLSASESERLIANGTIEGGMVPKVRCALRALARGAAGVVIADGTAEAALSRALEDASFGTRWESTSTG